jgi:hypothetical protein
LRKRLEAENLHFLKTVALVFEMPIAIGSYGNVIKSFSTKILPELRIVILRKAHMKISFEFDMDGLALPPTNLARMLLDIQHLVDICAALADTPIQGDNVIFVINKQNYKRLIEAGNDDVDKTDLVISRIKMESPLWIELVVKLPLGTTESFKIIFTYLKDHIFQVTRKRKGMSMTLQKQQLENITLALNINEKIPDKELQSQFKRGLDSLISSFVNEHPPIKLVDLVPTVEEPSPIQSINPDIPVNVPEPTPLVEVKEESILAKDTVDEKKSSELLTWVNWGFLAKMGKMIGTIILIIILLSILLIVVYEILMLYKR